ncbi:o-succinylbenzoate synthase [Canibacter zhoujuaniae]|uniref:o-succinylbenzoate synthase n=1 Tax=Canibacter zhoujuaniae TaxID=2708343 RepID=UPI001422E959|nr:o-succinylbenzoate synthase [Canibacter zhoujuaniae]
MALAPSPTEHLPDPLPSLDELRERARVVSIPLRVKFRGVLQREVMLFAGPNGWAEWAPFLEYGPAESARWLCAALAQGWGSHPPLLRDRIAVNVTVPAVPAQRVPEVLARYGDLAALQKIKAVKVKVAETGQSLAADTARIAAVRRALGESVLLRLDANAGWSVSDALNAALRLQEFNIDYFEQPVATLAELKQLRQEFSKHEIRARIAADELLRKAPDPFDKNLQARLREAADLVIVKQAPLGGVRRTLAIIESLKLPTVVSSGLETGVGIAAGLKLAAALPDALLDGPCGLATGSLLQRDILTQPHSITAGEIAVRAPAVSAAALHETRASVSRETWWHSRLAQSYQALLADG